MEIIFMLKNVIIYINELKTGLDRKSDRKNRMRDKSFKSFPCHIVVTKMLL